MADNVDITAGAGTTIATDDVAGVQYQRVKLDGGGDGAAAPILGDSANGLDVDVTRCALPTGASTLAEQQTQTAALGAAADAEAAGNGSIIAVLKRLRTLLGSLGLDATIQAVRDRLPAALVSGRLDVNIGASAATVPVSDAAGSLTVDDGGLTLSVDDGGGALTVDGTVTANQGTPAAAANAWMTKISDGTDTVGISTVSAAKALKVDVVQSVGPGAVADKGAFTEGTTTVQVVAGVVNDTIGADPAEDTAAGLRLTVKRGLHVNLRNVGGTEIGTAGAPVRVDPTGSTTQPVLDTNSAAQLTALQLIDDGVATLGSATPAKGMVAAGHDGTNARALSTQTNGHVNIHDGGNVISVDDGAGSLTVDFASAQPVNVSQFGGSNVVAAAAGIPKVGCVDEAGASFTDANPMPVSNANLHRTVLRAAVTFPISQTDVAVLTPTGGKKIVVESIFVKISAGGVLKIFADSNSSANMLLEANFATDDMIQLVFPNGHPLDANDEVLRYTSDGTATGRFVVFGYEI